MQAVITADIINSEKVQPDLWMNPLKEFFKKQKINSKEWAIYRGDEIQVFMTNHVHSLRIALRLKALVKSISNKIDIKIAIGIGNPEFYAQKITESNGPVFIRSGRLYEQIKKSKVNLAIASPDNQNDKIINLMLKLASVITDKWTIADAELIYILLDNKHKLVQSEIADQLGIKQSGVSRRKTRAGYDNITLLLEYFENENYRIQVDDNYNIAAEP